MAKKFSLKNNTIFQRTEPPGPPENTPAHIATAVRIVTETTPLELSNPENKDKDSSECQNLTLKNRVSEFDPQILIPKENNSTSLLKTIEDTSTVHTTTEAPGSEKDKRSNFENKTEDISGYQVSTLKNRVSGFDPHNLTLKEPDRKQEQPDNRLSSFPSPLPLSSSAKEFSREAPVSPTSPPSQQTAMEDLGLRDHFDKSLFFSFYNEMSDELLPTLNASEQVLYHRLFRLAYGFNRNYCTVSQSALEDRTNLSRNTIRTAMRSLIKEGLIRIIESNNRASTTYRVILLREKENRRVIFERQIMPVKIRGSEINQRGEQISDVQNLLPRNQNDYKLLKKDDIYDRVSNFEGQNMTPLLSLTHRSFTLSHSTTRGEGDEQNLISKDNLPEQNFTSTNLNLWAQELVNRFYSLLGQRVAKKKRERNLQECITLLQEDRFSVEEIDYAISWLVAHQPTTGDFSRLSYFIGQALKDREKNQQVIDAQHQRIIAARQQQEEEQKTKENQQKLEKITSSISPETLEVLTAEAHKFVMQQYPKGGIGQEMLVRLKLEELIKELVASFSK